MVMGKDRMSKTTIRQEGKHASTSEQNALAQPFSAKTERPLKAGKTLRDEVYDERMDELEARRRRHQQVNP